MRLVSPPPDSQESKDSARRTQANKPQERLSFGRASCLSPAVPCGMIFSGRQLRRLSGRTRFNLSDWDLGYTCNECAALLGVLGLNELLELLDSAAMMVAVITIAP